MVITWLVTRKPKTAFEKLLRSWQGDKRDKEAAELLGVNLATYRHWLYHGIKPSESKCKACVLKIIQPNDPTGKK